MTEHAARDRLWAATLDAVIRDMGAAIRRMRPSPNWPGPGAELADAGLHRPDRHRQ